MEFIRLANKLIHLTVPELQQIQRDPETTALEQMLIAVIIKATNQGDDKRLTFYLDRLLGKVPDKIDLTGNQTINFDDISKEELDERMEKILRRLKRVNESTTKRGK